MDHVLFVGKSLSDMERGFADAGFESTYGGSHDTNPTHNSLIGFADGSYIELLSTVTPEVDDPMRNHHMNNDAGPCGWAIEVDDLDRIIERGDRAGLDTWGPIAMSRETPRDTVASWELAGYESAVRGELLPFFISDTTPRERRISPTDGVAGSELTGIETVVIGTSDLDRTTQLFESVFDLSVSRQETDPDQQLELVQYPAESIVLASPTAESSWLTDRLDKFGDGISAFAIGTAHFDRSVETRPVSDRSNWFGRSIGWLDVGPYTGKIGVVGDGNPP